MEATPPSIGLYSKVPNQECIMERLVLVFSLLDQNASEWHFLRCVDFFLVYCGSAIFTPTYNEDITDKEKI